ncbi:Zn-dependent exopeptidase [Fragilariopsis cylindrus CCMP1102]|uniref:Zn-dependent exopeptidase n=1 Tax=Fragilariopsis cylindrus CCMP1102 TaxID=635003 RepID=A0A1E7EP10_9STRA|nr:Zn-dependent exopeptidase [Fragilariopsis cylindrus CCMP1102]|eukprot:OEU07605.1 Zn-dependent exopeptidase [Fragilariopsis cylindrus CCMP1102]
MTTSTSVSMTTSTFVSFVTLLLLLLQLPCVASEGDDFFESYRQLSLDEIVGEMQSLATRYPQFVTYDTSQNRYELPTTCPLSQEDQNTGCYNHFLIISDPITYSHKSGQIALQQRPDVFLSGALHGNERVGPVALMNVAKLLVESASCQAKLTVDGIDYCAALKKYLDKETVSWLARLVTTRRIVIVPNPNSSGYYLNQRFENYINPNGQSTNGFDPNRDFPYNAKDSSQCMKSITARTINELFLDNLFQMSMSYHGGIELIGFSWGAIGVPSNRVSPDDVAQRILTDKISLYAGELYSSGELNTSPNGRFYETGVIKDILYGVNGSFEDYAYTGSWENQLQVEQCTPSTYDGYPAEKTQYDDATLRTFNILVEISKTKDPPSSELGTNVDLFNAPFAYDNNANNGYAAKHIRTALMAIDMVEPYVEIIKFQKKTFNSEIRPLKKLRKIDADFKKRRWQKRRKLVKTRPKLNRKVKWSVGGSINVDETYLIYGNYNDFPDSFGSVNQLNQSDINAAIEIATSTATTDNQQLLYITEIQSGGTRWTDPTSSEVPQFSTFVDLTPFKKGDELAVYALAKVDQNWKNTPTNGKVWPENSKIQSHIVQQRTDANYVSSKDNIGRTVQGRLDWISAPLTISIKSF